jgi:hypothetical protein
MGEIKMRQHNPLKAGLSWEKDQYLGKNQKEIERFWGVFGVCRGVAGCGGVWQGVGV